MTFTILNGAAALMLCCAGLGMAQQTTGAVPSKEETTATGKISGVVQDSDGSPVAKVKVAVNVRPTTPDVPFFFFNTVVTTGADGIFTVDHVPDGSYSVCATPPDEELLPNCAWGPEPIVTVKGGTTASAPTLRMAKGADLYIRFNDPNGRRAALESRARPAWLTVSVSASPGTMRRVPRTATDKGGFDYHLRVPVETDLVVSAQSEEFGLADEKGVAADKKKGHVQTVNVKANKKQEKIVINVSNN